MQDDTNSRFGGLGVVVSQREGNLIIVSPMEDTPGFKAGLLPDDQIIKIDGRIDGEDGSRRRDQPAPRRAGAEDHADDLRPGDQGDQRFHAHPREHQGGQREGCEDSAGGTRRRIQDRLRADHAVQRADRGGSGEEARRTGEARACRRWCSICATIPAGCSIPRSMSPAISAAEDARGFHRRPRAVAEPHLSHRRQGEAAAAISAGHPDQWRQRERLGDRRRRAQGSEPRDPRRRDDLRQRLRAERHPASGRLRAAADDGEILHAEQAGHPRARRGADHPRHAYGRAGAAAHAAAAARMSPPIRSARNSPTSATRNSNAPSMRSKA